MDNGTITLTGLGESIPAGEKKNWLIVYDFTSDNAALQLTIAKNKRPAPWSVPAALTGIVLLILVAKRAPKAGRVLVACCMIAAPLAGCGFFSDEDSAADEHVSGTYTFQVAIAETAHIKATGAASGSAADVLGAPAQGPEVTVTFSDISAAEEAQEAADSSGSSSDSSDSSATGGCGWTHNTTAAQ